MSKLPNMVYSDRIGKTTQIAFGGLRHHVNCSDGELFDMENISVEQYPVMSVRGKRGEKGVCSTQVRQIYADNGAMLQVDPVGLYYNDWLLIKGVKDCLNTYFIRFGDRVVMMPDKKLLNMKYPIIGWAGSKTELPETAELYDAYAVYDEGGHYIIYVWDGIQWIDNGWFDEPIETNCTFSSVTVKNGEIYEEEASANTIKVPFTYEYIINSLRLREGDAVKISGMTTEPRNNKLAIIREISEGLGGTCEIRFSDYCFYIPDDAESYVEENVTIERTMPDMDFMFEHANRLWGAKGKGIFASKQGDPRNWNVFDGLATDSWYLESQSKGSFTGGISFGYPRFFKEDSLMTVYGSIPSAFQTNETPVSGLKEGEDKSLAVVNGLLFWLSRRGLMIYDGSSAYLQDQVFGDWELSKALAKGDATKYYISADIGEHPLADGERLRAVFCYDTNRSLWARENGYAHDIISMTYDGGAIYALVEGDTKILTLNGQGDLEAAETQVESYAEFGDFTDGSPNRKALSKLQLRLEIGEGASVSVWILYDGSGDWLRVKSLESGNKRSVYLPVIPHRCDHYRVKITGIGEWKLYSMARELYVGSEIH